MIRLGLAVNPAHRARGFHSTATLGAFGAAVAAGQLLDLAPVMSLTSAAAGALAAATI